jgi:hypothetical protein
VESCDITSRLVAVFVHHVVLALALDEVDPWDGVVAGESVHRCAERVGDLANGAVEAMGNPNRRCT